MNKIIDLEEVKIKLYTILKPSGWANVLKSFIFSEDFTKILEGLVKQSDDGGFTPPLKYLFRAFTECPYDSLKVVWVLQDPYPKIHVADGIPMSCSLTNKEQPTLRYVNEAIKRTVYKDEEWEGKTDLKYLSNQGVLLLNTALTTKINQPGAHIELWKPFTVFLLDTLSTNKQLFYIFSGKHAAQYLPLVAEHNEIYVTSHPASASYKNEEIWDCEDVFNKVNIIKW